MGLTELGQLLAGRQLSAPEVARAFLDRIRLEDSRWHSYLTLCEERAMTRAKAAQRALDGGTAGPLTGLPLAVKDNICIHGIRTTCASRMLADFVPPYTATAVERLEGAGMVVLGKTNMDEFAMGSTSQTSCFGGPENPAAPGRVPGGSSGGSAAAVAAGLAPAALGTDTGGSVQQPAAFCGLTGLRPTYGAVSRYGLIAFASSMDQIGPIARTPADCRLLFRAMAGQDPRDATSRKGTPPAAGGDAYIKTIGLPVEFYKDLSPETAALAARTAAAFENLGWRVREVSLPSYRYGVAAYYLLSSAEAASNLSRYDGVRYGLSGRGNTYAERVTDSRNRGFGREVERRILLGNYALSRGYYQQYYQRAAAVRESLRAEFDALFSECRLLLVPTAPEPAWPVGQKDSQPAEQYAADACTVPASLAGLPALTFPAGRTAAGLPVGMSLMGRAFDEEALLDAAEAFLEGGGV